MALDTTEGNIYAHHVEINKSDESHLLHHPNLVWTKLQSESMKIPQLTSHLKSDGVDEEISHIIDLLKIAKTKPNVHDNTEQSNSIIVIPQISQ